MFFYEEKLLHLGNIVHVKYVESDLIIVQFEKYTLQIYGNNLVVIQLAEDQMYIQGNIEELELKYA